MTECLDTEIETVKRWDDFDIVWLPLPGERILLDRTTIRAIPVINHEGETTGVFYELRPAR